MAYRFISFEGIDGAGKTTHIQQVKAYLESLGHVCVLSREPGGTPVGERIRDIVLHQTMPAKAQLLLMYAARYQHVHTYILPALQQGTWVLCDRFEDSSFAYQASAAGLGVAACEALSSWVLEGFAPGLTLLFDLPPEEARQRALARNHAMPDEFKRQPLGYMEQVRAGFLQRAKDNPQRIHVIDASQTEQQVGRQVMQQMNTYLALHANVQG